MKTTTTFLRMLQTGGLFLLLLCCAALGANGQADAPLVKIWDKVYGGEGDDKLTTIVPLADGGYLLGGYSNSDAGYEKSEDHYGFGFYDYWILRVDARGVPLWDKTYGGYDNDWLYHIVQTSDGGFLLGGTSESDMGLDKSEPGRGGNDYWVVRIDAQGGKLWDKTYGGAGAEELYHLFETPDGGFLLGGHSASGAGPQKTEPSRGQNDYWIVRIDAQGKALWDKTYGGEMLDHLSAFAPAADGGFLLCGSSASGAGFEKSEDPRNELSPREDIWVVRIDAEGNQLWDKTYGGEYWDALAAALPAADGGFLLAGASYSNAGFEKSEDARGDLDYWLVRIDASGEIVWDKTYGGEGCDTPHEIAAAADGGFLLAGFSKSDAGF